MRVVNSERIRYVPRVLQGQAEDLKGPWISAIPWEDDCDDYASFLEALDAGKGYCEEHAIPLTALYVAIIPATIAVFPYRGEA